MPTYEETVAAIKHVADIQVKSAKEIFDLDFDYSEASANTLDEMITRGWNGVVPTMLEQMVQGIGAYLGEVLVRSLGGVWKEEQGRWVVRITLSDGSYGDANVFAKVEKRFVNGMEDSLSYYVASLKKMQQEGVPGQNG